MLKIYELTEIIANSISDRDGYDNWEELIHIDVEFAYPDKILINFVEMIDGDVFDNKFVIKSENINQVENSEYDESLSNYSKDKSGTYIEEDGETIYLGEKSKEEVSEAVRLYLERGYLNISVKFLDDKGIWMINLL